MKRVVLAVLIVALLAVVVQSQGDYVEVRRNAWIKKQPDSAAESHRAAVLEEHLPLVSDSQTNGYYKVALEGGQSGWIYRTLVRRFPGDVPERPDIDGEAETETNGSVWLNISGTAASSHVYAGHPISTDPQIPVTVLVKPFFTIGYSEARRNPLWVCYRIGPATDLTTYEPKSSFKTDKGTSSRVSHSDYTNSGYSRGHMAPRFAISSRFGQDGNDSTFVMTNVCPQFQNYNDGQWGNLEEWVAGRKLSTRFIKGWADEYETVWVTVGPIFDEDREPLLSDVQMPNAFYCIVLDEEQGRPRVIAFILEHVDERDHDLTTAIRTVRQVEERTGLDFFSGMPDDVESQIETVAVQNMWTLPVNPN